MYVRPVPRADTVNVAAPPSATVVSAGPVSTTGAFAFTRRRPELVTLPAAFVAVTANTAPSSLNATLDTVSVALVAPGTATPSRVHA